MLTFANIIASTVASGHCLLVPVTPPQKRVRPSDKRKRSALEIISRHLRANAGKLQNNGGAPLFQTGTFLPVTGMTKKAKGCVNKLALLYIRYIMEYMEWKL